MRRNRNQIKNLIFTATRYKFTFMIISTILKSLRDNEDPERVKYQ